MCILSCWLLLRNNRMVNSRCILHAFAVVYIALLVHLRVTGVRWDFHLLEEHIDSLIVVLDHIVGVLSEAVNVIVELWVELLLLDRLVKLVLLVLRKVVDAYFLRLVEDHAFVRVRLHYLVLDSALLEFGKGV